MKIKYNIQIEADYLNAYVKYNDVKIYRKKYPNIFDALSKPIPTGHHFGNIIIPIQGVKTKTLHIQTLSK